MDMKRCNRGHFYDGEKYKTCPYCQEPDAVPAKTVPVREEEPAPSPVPQPTQDPFGSTDDDGKTVGIFKKTVGKDPVVGWLVAIKGKHYGESFTLKTGRNFIGRARDMDVVLSADESVSRNKHAVVLYDPKANLFILQPGESRELTYLNGNVLLDSKEIHIYDIITLGNSELMFVPFCGDRFVWDENKLEDKD